jgi:UDP-glucose 4-epimerase
MKVLVTGGAGYIGSHVVLALRDRGWPCVVIDDLSTGSRSLLPGDVELVAGDVGDAALIGRLIKHHKVTSIVHLAASTSVPDSIRQPLLYYANNAAKTCTLLQAAITHGVAQFVFSSTAAVYGTPQTQMVDEDAPLNPQSPYGASKLMAETILRDAGTAYGLKFCTLRYFNVAGADPALRTGQLESGALIKLATQAALGKRPGFKIFGTDYGTPDGSCIRDFIHVTDLATAHLSALDYLAQGGASLTLNCGYGRGYSVLEIVNALKRIAGCDFPVDIGPRRPGDIDAIIAGNKRIRQTLAWSPQYDDVEIILRHALAWEQRLQGAAVPTR